MPGACNKYYFAIAGEMSSCGVRMRRGPELIMAVQLETYGGSRMVATRVIAKPRQHGRGRPSACPNTRQSIWCAISRVGRFTGFVGTFGPGRGPRDPNERTILDVAEFAIYFANNPTLARREVYVCM